MLCPTVLLPLSHNTLSPLASATARYVIVASQACRRWGHLSTPHRRAIATGYLTRAEGIRACCLSRSTIATDSPAREGSDVYGPCSWLKNLRAGYVLLHSRCLTLRCRLPVAVCGSFLPLLPPSLPSSLASFLPRFRLLSVVHTAVSTVAWTDNAIPPISLSPSSSSELPEPRLRLPSEIPSSYLGRLRGLGHVEIRRRRLTVPGASPLGFSPSHSLLRAA
ncbi:hypothetical protein FB45DRAFT_918472 [Roridomyces roridus]|uniref:Uncharacterized protein n=1 Tax=Roridomyces roridus TaxID=1738132 RepID=A0AAD7BR65_9AGAR|nr:hypothetical protein FB45DRAFT_918472 [Roridomyces roridus]